MLMKQRENLKDGERKSLKNTVTFLSAGENKPKSFSGHMDSEKKMETRHKKYILSVYCSIL